jgi:hypothetical protein
MGRIGEPRRWRTPPRRGLARTLNRW